MTNKRYAAIWLRIGLLSSALLAIFWAIWSIYAPVPANGVLELSKTLKFVMPGSRWLDVIFAFFMVNTYAWSIRLLWLACKDKCSLDDFVVGLALGLLAGFFVGFAIVLGAGLAFGLVTGLFFSLAASLAFGLGAGLGVFGLAIGLKYLFSNTLWNKVSSWFTAKDID